jgi:hypothetical protein
MMTTRRDATRARDDYVRLGSFVRMTDGNDDDDDDDARCR